jgi:hypothetical protein
MKLSRKVEEVDDFGDDEAGVEFVKVRHAVELHVSLLPSTSITMGHYTIA